MKLRKEISYAYSGSQNAQELGRARNGCWYVAQQCLRDDGCWSMSYIAPGCGNEGFATPDDPDLIALYLKTNGEPCPMFLRYGNADALAAIAKVTP